MRFKNFLGLSLILGAALLALPLVSQGPAAQTTAPETAVAVKHVTQATFKAEVEDSDIPVLIDFTATWCGPCRMIAPHVEQLAKDFAGKVKVVKVDVDNDPGLARQYGVNGIPNLVIVYPKKSGLANDRSVGYKDLPALKQFVQSAVDKFKK